MTIYLYGKKGCGKCEAAEKKLKDFFKVAYRKIDMEANPPPEDWRKNGIVEAMALYSYDETLPFVGIDLEDGKGLQVYSYSEGMRVLKKNT